MDVDERHRSTIAETTGVHDYASGMTNERETCMAEAWQEHRTRYGVATQWTEHGKYAEQKQRLRKAGMASRTASGRSAGCDAFKDCMRKNRHYEKTRSERILRPRFVSGGCLYLKGHDGALERLSARYSYINRGINTMLSMGGK